MRACAAAQALRAGPGVLNATPPALLSCPAGCGRLLNQLSLAEPPALHWLPSGGAGEGGMVAGGGLDLREDRLLFGFNHVYGGGHQGSAGAHRGPRAGAGGNEDAPYADRSAVCPAAIHAGVVGASGGGAQVGARPGARARAPARAACRRLTRAGARQCFSLKLGGGRARYLGAPEHGVEALSVDLSLSADPARAAAFSFGVAPSATLCPQQLRWHLAASTLLLAAAAVVMSPPPFLLWALLALLALFLQSELGAAPASGRNTPALPDGSLLLTPVFIVGVYLLGPAWVLRGPRWRWQIPFPTSQARARPSPDGPEADPACTSPRG